MSVALVSVYTYDSNIVGHNYNHLYEILKERKPDESISHKVMPTLEEHYRFIEKRPYHCWYLIQDLEDYKVVGAIYLSEEKEIGISIYDKYRRRGYASEAIKALMEAHPQPYFLANVNPDNLKSRDLFEKLGFIYHCCKKYRLNIIQETYILIPGGES